MLAWGQVNECKCVLPFDWIAEMTYPPELGVNFGWHFALHRYIFIRSEPTVSWTNTSISIHDDWSINNSNWHILRRILISGLFNSIGKSILKCKWNESPIWLGTCKPRGCQEILLFFSCKCFDQQTLVITRIDLLVWEWDRNEAWSRCLWQQVYETW